VPEAEHLLKEAPYLLADAKRRGWGVRCSCGWRSQLMETSDDALAEGQRHLVHPDLDVPDDDRKGVSRLFRRKPRPAWEERRRD
jgi:hypothetical protein